MPTSFIASGTCVGTGAGPSLFLNPEKPPSCAIADGAKPITRMKMINRRMKSLRRLRGRQLAIVLQKQLFGLVDGDRDDLLVAVYPAIGGQVALLLVSKIGQLIVDRRCGFGGELGL